MTIGHIVVHIRVVTATFQALIIGSCHILHPCMLLVGTAAPRLAVACRKPSTECGACTVVKLTRFDAAVVCHASLLDHCLELRDATVWFHAVDESIDVTSIAVEYGTSSSNGISSSYI